MSAHKRELSNGAVIALLVIFAKAYLSRTKIYSSVSLEVAAAYWHFVDLVWVFVFLCFYLL